MDFDEVPQAVAPFFAYQHVPSLSVSSVETEVESPSPDSLAGIVTEDELAEISAATPVRRDGLPRLSFVQQKRREEERKMVRNRSLSEAAAHSIKSALTTLEEDAASAATGSTGREGTGTPMSPVPRHLESLTIAPRKPRRRSLNSISKDRSDALALIELHKTQSLPSDIKLGTSKVEQGVDAVLEGQPESLTKLLAIDLNVEGDYALQFLASFRLFTTPEAVFTSLVATFADALRPSNPKDEVIDDFNDGRRNRVIQVIRMWIDHFFFDFRSKPDLLAKLGAFLASESVQGDNENGRAIELTQDALTAALERKHPALYDYVYDPSVPTLVGADDAAAVASMDFMSMSSVELTQQLCIIEMEMFQALSIDGLVNQRWVKRNSDSAPSVFAHSISFFNRIAFWVATQVVTAPRNKQRAALIERFISMGRLCKEWNNFSTLFQIFSGLNMAPVQRLERAWAKVSQKHKSVFNMLSRYASGERNFSVYREALAQTQPPLVPYVGIFCKDISACVDGMSYRTSNGAVQFSRLMPYAHAIENAVRLQRVSYGFKPNERIMMWIATRLEVFDEVQLYDHVKKVLSGVKTTE